MSEHHDELAAAYRRQADTAASSWRVDRRGWTTEQWADDARRLMDEPDGAITSLVNGHVMALLRLVADGLPARRLPCGCPDVDEYLDPCPGHVWSHWHPSPIDALREDRFCLYCGAMETQRIEAL